MSGFSMWDADEDVQNAPQRQAKTASLKLEAAINDVRAEYGSWIVASTGKDEFEDRWHFAKADIRNTVNNHLPPVTGVMRRVHDALKREFKATLTRDDDNDDEETTVEPKGKGDKARTINDSQYKKVKDGDKSVTDEVKTNTGDGSDAEGRDPSPTTGKQDDPRDSGPSRGKSSSRRTAEDFDGELHPDDNFEGYLDSVDQGGPEKVERNFGESGDSGKDKTSAIVADLYTDWANSNGMRVASLNTLEQYADTGISDSEYFHLSNLIRAASGDDCECDDDEDTDGPEGDDTDSDGPPQGAAEKGGESEDSDSDSDSDSDDGSDSDSDSGGGNPFGDEGDTSEEDSADDGGGEEADPFGDGGSDEGAPVADEDSGFDAPDEAPDFGDDSGDPAGPPQDDAGGDPAGPPQGDPNGFDAPQGPPDFSDAPPLAQDDFSSVDEYNPEGAAQLPAGTELVAVEQIEDALGLPPGTLEQILSEATGGGSGAPPQGPPPGPPHMGRRRRQAAEGDSPDPSAGASPAAGGQAVAPAAGGAAAPAGPDDTALLDQASQAMTSLVDQKTTEYQTLIDPLQQALQAIQFAQQVQQAENPLDVTPPEGTVDVGPGAAAPDPAAGGDPAAMGAAPQSATPPAPPAPAADPQQRAQVAFRIAKAYDLSESGYRVILEAMGRKQYQHVAEAIQTLPPEYRIGVASSLADMFKQDNVRFNPGVFLQASGVDPRAVVAARADEVAASRHPFARRSPRTAGETWKDTAVDDSFEFANPGNPKVDDGMSINNLPNMNTQKTKVGGVVEDFQRAKSHDQSRGLGYGGDAEIESFFQDHKGYGDRARTKLHQEEGVAPHGKTASFFTRKVAGWDWDDHLNGYVTAKRKPFICTTANCDEQIPTPSHTQCKCGKLWNTYAIGDNSHLASDSAQMYIAREIPIRDGVIMANRKMAEADDDLDLVSDDELEDADAPHAPGKTASAAPTNPQPSGIMDDPTNNPNGAGGLGKALSDVTGVTPESVRDRQKQPLKMPTAAQYGDDDHNPVDRDGEKFCSQCDAMLWDPNIHHCPIKQAALEKLDDDNDEWKTHSEDDDAGYKSTREAPSTEGKQPPKDWASRGSGGKWVAPQFK